MENELSRVVDALPGLVWTALPDGHVDFVNQGWCDYTGLGRDQVSGNGWQAAIHPVDLPDLLERWQVILTSREPREMQARVRRFDGEYHQFVIRARPLTDASGQVIKWCGVNTDIEDCIRTEQTSRASDVDFRTVADSIPALVALMTPAGEVESVNRHVLEYLGATLEELKCWATADTVHPDDLPSVVAAWTRSVGNGEPYDIEHRIRRADGAYHWFHVRGLPLRDGEGRITQWCVLQADIDERKRDKALLAGEKRLLEMVARGHAMSEVLESLCLLVESTVAGCRCSVALTDSVGERLERCIGPSLPSGFINALVGRPVNLDSGPCAMATCLNEQVIASDISSDARLTSEWRHMALTHGIEACWSTPISAATGAALGAFAIYYDKPRSPTPQQQALIGQFTHIAGIAIERARGEAALKQSDAFLAKAQRLSSTGTFSWRVATGEITWSEEIYRIYDLDPAIPATFELIDTRMHPDDMPSHNEMRRQQRVDGADFEHEHRLLMSDGTVKYLHLDAHATWDHDGQLEYIGAVQDVTEHRLSQENLGRVRSELAHLARVATLGALTASIAHEVNQPLAGIVTNANTCLRMLAANPPNVDGARETARRTIRDGNRASDVIKRLRALFTKKDAMTENLNLNEAAREVIAMLLDELQRHGILLQTEFANDIPPIMGDRVQLQQVILNLLLNASDAMDAVVGRPRKLVIRTEQDGEDHVRLTVRDTGAGFDPEDADRLFTAFYTTKGEGMGIGLSISHSIIESHYGRLWAAPNDGPGATFAFSIPCLPDSVTKTRGSDTFRPDSLTNQDHTVEIF